MTNGPAKKTKVLDILSQKPTRKQAAGTEGVVFDVDKKDSDESDTDDDFNKFNLDSVGPVPNKVSSSRRKQYMVMNDSKTNNQDSLKKPKASPGPTNKEAWTALRNDLEAERQAFIDKNARARAHKVNKWDAGELDNVYQDVFERCEKYETAMTPQDYREQFEDCKAVILRKRIAQPGDKVFLEKIGTLESLNPASAEPRIELGTDNFNYRVTMRWNAWMQDGYPERIPYIAIRQDEKIQQGYALEDLVGLTDKHSDKEHVTHPLAHTR